jgi:hypothetical protein
MSVKPTLDSDRTADDRGDRLRPGTGREDGVPQAVDLGGFAVRVVPARC